MQKLIHHVLASKFGQRVFLPLSLALAAGSAAFASEVGANDNTVTGFDAEPSYSAPADGVQQNEVTVPEVTVPEVTVSAIIDTQQSNEQQSNERIIWTSKRKKEVPPPVVAPEVVTLEKEAPPAVEVQGPQPQNVNPASNGADQFSANAQAPKLNLTIYAGTWKQSQQGGYVSPGPIGPWIYGVNASYGRWSVDHSRYGANFGGREYRTVLSYQANNNTKVSWLNRGGIGADIVGYTPIAFGYQPQTQSPRDAGRGGLEPRSEGADGLQVRKEFDNGNRVIGTAYRDRFEPNRPVNFQLSFQNERNTVAGKTFSGIDFNLNKQSINLYGAYTDYANQITYAGQLFAAGASDFSNQFIFGSAKKELGNGLYAGLSAGLGSYNYRTFAPEIGFKRTFADSRTGVGGGIYFGLGSNLADRSRMNFVGGAFVSFKVGGGSTSIQPPVPRTASVQAKPVLEKELTAAEKESIERHRIMREIINSWNLPPAAPTPAP
jgi:hypothetical protein